MSARSRFYLFIGRFTVRVPRLIWQWLPFPGYIQGGGSRG